jgi:hypothetical protein
MSSETNTDIPDEYTPTKKRHTPNPTGKNLPARIATETIEPFQLIEFSFREGGTQYWFAAEFDRSGGTRELRMRNVEDPDTTWKIPAKWLSSSRFTPCTTVVRNRATGEETEQPMVGYSG